MRLGLADEVLTRAAELRTRGVSFAVATVVRVDPPTSASPGDKALVTADGELFGWIGGSCSEGLVRREALVAIGDGQPRLVKIAPEIDPLLYPSPEGREHSHRDPLPDPAHAGNPATLTPLAPRKGEGDVVAYRSTCPSAGALDVFIDPQLPRPLLLVVGATPAARTLVRIGAAVGFRTWAVDPGASAADFPEADAVVGSLELSSGLVGPDTWAVVATMGHYDEDALAALLPFDLPYLGVIASRRRMQSVLDVLTQRGVGGLDRIRRASGDAVGRSQQEIALAVMAEIVAERQAREPAPLLSKPTAVDPICGMTVDVDRALHSVAIESTTYYFCSAHCREAFVQQHATASRA
jgi:xanthine dehydrogenase accessory factor